MNRKRSGFTLVEMLVVLFIIAILAALILPAIQSARVRSRQVQCASRLAGLGKALAAYESSMHAFPPALAFDRATRSSDRFYAAHVFLLPYLGHQPLADKINLRKQQFYVWDTTDLPLMKESLSAFICPADRSAGAGRPGNNYRLSMGPGPYSICSHLSPCEGIGGFRALYAHTAADFSDGLSYTIGMSEKLVGGGSSTYFDRTRDFWYSGVNALEPLPRLDAMIDVCSSVSAQPSAFHPYSGATWFLGGYENTWYNHAVPPNSHVPDCAADPLFDPFSPDVSTNGGVFGASSYHRGGVNCLFMGGSVKFIADKIDLRAWRALSTRSGGEVVSNSLH